MTHTIDTARRAMLTEALKAKRAGLPFHRVKEIARSVQVTTLATNVSPVTLRAGGRSKPESIDPPPEPPKAPESKEKPSTPAADDIHHATFAAYLDALIRVQEATDPEQREVAEQVADRLYAMIHGEEAHETTHTMATDSGGMHYGTTGSVKPKTEHDPAKPWAEYQGPHGGWGAYHTKTGSTRLGVSHHDLNERHARRMAGGGKASEDNPYPDWMVKGETLTPHLKATIDEHRKSIGLAPPGQRFDPKAPPPLRQGGGDEPIDLHPVPKQSAQSPSALPTAKLLPDNETQHDPETAGRISRVHQHFADTHHAKSDSEIGQEFGKIIQHYPTEHANAVASRYGIGGTDTHESIGQKIRGATKHPPGTHVRGDIVVPPKAKPVADEPPTLSPAAPAPAAGRATPPGTTQVGRAGYTRLPQPASAAPSPVSSPATPLDPFAAYQQGAQKPFRSPAVEVPKPAAKAPVAAPATPAAPAPARPAAPGELRHNPDLDDAFAASSPTPKAAPPSQSIRHNPELDAAFGMPSAPSRSAAQAPVAPVQSHPAVSSALAPTARPSEAEGQSRRHAEYLRQQQAAKAPAAPLFAPENQPAEESPKPEAQTVAQRHQSLGDPTGEVRVVPTNQLHRDPERFQYKQNVNKEGVTDSLKGVNKFDPEKSGILAVWHDPADKKDYVVNGHHRHEFAERAGHPELAVRYIKAATAEEARSKGALINMGENNGTAVDAAKFMRDRKIGPEGLAQEGISLKSSLVKDATSLRGLSDSLFSRVARGQMDEKQAAAIGKHLAGKEDLQHQLVNYIAKSEAKGSEWSPVKVEAAARRIAFSPTTKGDSGDLFGTETEQSYLEEQADLSSFVRGELAKQQRDFQAVSSERRAGNVASAGNTLNIEKNKELAKQHAQGHELFDRSVDYKGPLSDLINEYAQKYANANEADRKKLKLELLSRTQSLLAAGPSALGAGVAEGSGQGAAGARTLSAEWGELRGSDGTPQGEVTDEKHLATFISFLSTLPDDVHFIAFLSNDGWERYEGPKGGHGWRNVQTGKVVYTASPTAPGFRRRQVQSSQQRARELGNHLASHHRGESDTPPTEAHLRELADHVQALPVHSLRSLKNTIMGTWGNVRRRAQMVEALTSHVRGLVEKSMAGQVAREEPQAADSPMPAVPANAPAPAQAPSAPPQSHAPPKAIPMPSVAQRTKPEAGEAAGETEALESPQAWKQARPDHASWQKDVVDSWHDQQFDHNDEDIHPDAKQVIDDHIRKLQRASGEKSGDVEEEDVRDTGFADTALGKGSSPATPAAAPVVPPAPEPQAEPVRISPDAPAQQAPEPVTEPSAPPATPPSSWQSLVGKYHHGGGAPPEESGALRSSYASLPDIERTRFAEQFGIDNAARALPEVRDDLVDRKIRELEFKHQQEQKGLRDEPDLHEGGLFNVAKKGVGESGGLFDEATEPESVPTTKGQEPPEPQSVPTKAGQQSPPLFHPDGRETEHPHPSLAPPIANLVADQKKATEESQAETAKRLEAGNPDDDWEREWEEERKKKRAEVDEGLKKMREFEAMTPEQKAAFKAEKRAAKAKKPGGTPDAPQASGATEEKKESTEAEAAPKDPAAERGGTTAMQPWHQEQFDSISKTMDRQLTEAGTANRKLIIATGLMQGEPPAVVAALVKHISEYHRDAFKEGVDKPQRVPLALREHFKEAPKEPEVSATGRPTGSPHAESVKAIKSAIEHVSNSQGRDTSGDETLAESMIDSVSSLKQPELYATLTAAGIEGARPGDSRSSLIQRLKNRLTASHRSRMRAEA